VDRDLRLLEAQLRSLETEYTKFFAGRLPRPPLELRTRVEQLVNRLDRMHIQNYGDRFRFTTLQSRHASLRDLWDRALRAREEGRAGAFTAGRRSEAPAAGRTGDEGLVHEAAFREPLREIHKLQALYESMAEARRNYGEEAMPFHRFATLVRDQVAELRQQGSSAVAFQVTVKEGKVRLTARGVPGSEP
jgi:hypothetical protein